MKDMDFDEMRNQIAMLKDKINKEEIVNERLMRQVMKSKMSVLNVSEFKHYLCATLCLLIYPVFAYVGIFSVGFAVVTCLMMLFCILGTLVVHMPTHRTDLMTCDLATVARIMRKLKQQYSFWIHYITPTLLVPCLTWACYEYATRNSVPDVNPFWVALPLLVGAMIGLIIGYSMHRKVVNAAQSIIDQIEEQ